jgi:hypothetical protein
MNDDDGNRDIADTGTGDDDVAHLIGLAGARPTRPEAEVAPIRAAVRRAWLRSVERHAVRRTRRRRWTLAAALAACLGRGSSALSAAAEVS